MLRLKHVKSFGRPRRLRKKIHCLNCGELVDGAKGINVETGPNPNDISICMHCGHVAVYGEKLKLRELTDAEVVAIAGDPVIVEAQRLRRSITRCKASPMPRLPRR
jgi:hypothetical protein